MYKQTLATVFALATLAGCASKPENPVDHFTYRNEPLVKQVEKGMTKERVLAIGGPASSEVKRTYRPGTCNNYILTTDGHQQPFHVSFDANGLVDHTGFMTCDQRQERERELHP